MLSRICLLLIIFSQDLQNPGQQTSPPVEQQANEIVLRDPFTLKLKLQGGSNYEEHFDQVPYVKDGNVYIFPGENFGVKASIVGEKIVGLRYVKDPKNADVRLKFTEELNGNHVMMMLVIESKLNRPLYLDASMELPNRRGAYKTTILPVLAGKMGFESWPHPIKILVLRSLRFEAKPPTS